MKSKFEQSKVISDLISFIIAPSYITHYKLFTSLRIDSVDIEVNKKEIAAYLAVHVVSPELRIAIELIYCKISLSHRNNLIHNIEKIMNLVNEINPDSAKHLDLLFEDLSFAIMSAPNDYQIQLPAQWQSLIPNYERKSNLQRAIYCIGHALRIEQNNTTAWLTLGQLFIQKNALCSDLPNFINIFEKSNIRLSPYAYANFCFQQVVDGKSPESYKQLAKYFMQLIKTTLENAAANQHQFFAAHPVSQAVPTEIPATSVGHIEEQNKIIKKFEERLALVNLQRSSFKKNQFQIINFLFAKDSNLTIRELKSAITDTECLIRLINQLYPKIVRLPFIYALFNHPDIQRSRNTSTRPSDEVFLRTIIKSVDDFEAIIRTLPEDKSSYKTQERLRKYIRISMHIKNLYDLARETPDNLVSLQNQPSLLTTRGAFTPQVNRYPGTLFHRRSSICEAIVIETDTNQQNLKRSFAPSDEPEVDEPANKRQKL
ncbi:hypothetical protein [Fluoribacter gormanii]|uniref:Uncharacterized protein n=1 Tax=Fluoribacter gormanii TaxID=464 RepID=A0A377GIM0_9GAMM|nr:hypothetical protein [Fluoribacter gormanii]KTD00244.1 hypothetical protein Lgor_3139 [Fluoribacter gormanii]SIQ88205.1 hypothetical protein SAMN05421777_10417 [Fluoribacter gormanii]STO24621.1 Uncharacterised protein [Fluoribacter gormanii]